MIDENILKNYSDIDISSLSRKSELGAKGFEEIIPSLEEFKNMIDEMIDIAKNVSIPNQLSNQINTFINQFISFSNQIKGYNLDNDARNGFRQRTQIIQGINNYVNQIFTGQNSFLNIYNAIKNFNLKGIQKEQEEVSRIKRELLLSKSDFDETIKLLKEKAGEKTVTEYSNIFEQQASKHSKLSFTNKFPFIKMGNAQIWLLIGITSLVILIATIIIFYENKNVFKTYEIVKLHGINGDYEKINYLIGNIIGRVLIISTFVYLVGYSFRQSSINRHLYTINKQKQNALDSYQLFSKSLSKDEQIKHLLMLEVAKSIYNIGQTGYLSDKSDKGPSNGIVELTKFIGDKS